MTSCSVLRDASDSLSLYRVVPMATQSTQRCQIKSVDHHSQHKDIAHHRQRIPILVFDVGGTLTIHRMKRPPMLNHSTNERAGFHISASRPMLRSLSVLPPHGHAAGASGGPPSAAQWQHRLLRGVLRCWACVDPPSNSSRATTKHVPVAAQHFVLR